MFKLCTATPDNTQQHATGSLNGHNNLTIEHPTMLHPFAQGLTHNRGGSRGRVQGVRTPLPPEMTCGFLTQLVFCKKKTMWFIGVEVEQETSALPPKKNPGSVPA